MVNSGVLVARPDDRQSRQQPPRLPMPASRAELRPAEGGRGQRPRLQLAHPCLFGGAAAGSILRHRVEALPTIAGRRRCHSRWDLVQRCGCEKLVGKRIRTRPCPNHLTNLDAGARPWRAGAHLRTMCRRDRQLSDRARVGGGRVWLCSFSSSLRPPDCTIRRFIMEWFSTIGAT